MIYTICQKYRPAGISPKWNLSSGQVCSLFSFGIQLNYLNKQKNSYVISLQQSKRNRVEWSEWRIFNSNMFEMYLDVSMASWTKVERSFILVTSCVFSFGFHTLFPHAKTLGSSSWSSFGATFTWKCGRRVFLRYLSSEHIQFRFQKSLNLFGHSACASSLQHFT